MRGANVTQGYWRNPGLTAELFQATLENGDGPFLRTGDLGFLHDGDVYICGRSKEVIIVNGRNYYPQDMEWEASKVAGVRKGNVIAFGARDPSGIERDRERVGALRLADALGERAHPHDVLPIVAAVRLGEDILDVLLGRGDGVGLDEGHTGGV